MKVLLDKVKRRIEDAADALPWKIKHAKKLQRFKDLHKGKSCIIIGNGPSLNQLDLEPISNCYTFGLNKIYLLEKKINLQLNYLVSVNRLVIEQSVQEFIHCPCPVFLSYSAAKHYSVDSPNTYYLHTGNIRGFYKDIGYPIYEGYTVTYVAMQLAYYMGFQKLYLIGVDHHFKQTGKPNQIQTMYAEDENHFDSQYFIGNKWQLADLKNSERSYKLAKHQFEQDGRNIYDATINGKLTIFKKVDFSEALRQCQI